MFPPLPRTAEASASSAIRTARNIVKDVGAKAARKSGGLVELAGCRERDPEKTTHQLLVKKLKLSLPIPLRMLNLPEDPTTGAPREYHCLHLRDWAKYILDSNAWHFLLGLRSPDATRERSIWAEFWERYRSVEAEHPIYSSGFDLSRTAALVAHGDEGRGRRRQAFFVASYHSVLGRGTVASQRVQKKEFLKMCLNMRGHTYVSRLMCGVLPRDVYADNEEVFQALLEVLASEAKFMYEHGVKDRNGDTFRMTVLKNVGDWPYLHKSGSFNRSFNNVQKRATMVRSPAGICHLCQAGQNHCPWEQFTRDLPTWLNTMFVQSPFASKPPFAQVPHSRGKLEGCWMFDMFHCWNLGVGKAYLGSVLALLSEREEASNIDKRFEALSSRYVMWCFENRRTPIIKKITKDMIQWPTLKDYPNGSWFKASLTTVLLDWVLDRGCNEDFSDDELLMCAMRAGDQMRQALQILYQSNVWLDARTAQRASSLGLGFLREYARAAALSHAADRSFFQLHPKHHALHHLFMDLKLSSRSFAWSINPLTWAVPCDEDFISRPSRLSRRVSSTTVILRVLQRYLQSAYTEWIAAGLIVQPQP